ncbi:hypothetical protein B0H16DRAFT_1456187 [Mycena metata]|uniref:Uncharacterized protein n=1 Tax=Mycena metata TaxID=1033252 RepID=A0AAD7JBN2_9AGAR|nr:hypothetical protein B0H16DRAFT_1456187 [Mycena metata]
MPRSQPPRITSYTVIICEPQRSKIKPEFNSNNKNLKTVGGSASADRPWQCSTATNQSGFLPPPSATCPPTPRTGPTDLQTGWIRDSISLKSRTEARRKTDNEFRCRRASAHRNRSGDGGASLGRRDRCCKRTEQVECYQLANGALAELCCRRRISLSVGGAGGHIPSASTDREYGVKGTARFDSKHNAWGMRELPSPMSAHRVAVFMSGHHISKLGQVGILTASGGLPPHGSTHAWVVRRKRAERHRSRRTIEFERVIHKQRLRWQHIGGKIILNQTKISPAVQDNWTSVMAALKLLPPAATNGYRNSCKFSLLRLKDNQSWRVMVYCDCLKNALTAPSNGECRFRGVKNRAATQTMVRPPIPELLLNNTGHDSVLFGDLSATKKEKSSAAAVIMVMELLPPTSHKLLKELLQRLKQLQPTPRREYNES